MIEVILMINTALIAVCAIGVTVLATIFYIHEKSIVSFKDIFLDQIRKLRKKE